MSKITSVLLAGAVLVGSTAAKAATQDYSGYDPEQIAYRYDYSADAEKTQYQGTVYDQGCVQSGNYVFVQRAWVPSAYYDATPIYVCTGGGPTLPMG